MEKQRHSLKIGNKVIKNLTLDDIIDIKLYLIRHKLERKEISRQLQNMIELECELIIELIEKNY